MIKVGVPRQGRMGQGRGAAFEPPLTEPVAQVLALRSIALG